MSETVPGDVRLYHNPRCSKCRKTFALLEERVGGFETIEYLVTPPGVEELRSLGRMLGRTPLEFMRTGEKRFAELGLSSDDDRTDDEWFTLMSENPILIQRPIVVNGDRAAIGRPPEDVLEIL